MQGALLHQLSYPACFHRHRRAGSSSRPNFQDGISCRMLPLLRSACYCCHQQLDCCAGKAGKAPREVLPASSIQDTMTAALTGWGAPFQAEAKGSATRLVASSAALVQWLQSPAFAASALAIGVPAGVSTSSSLALLRACKCCQAKHQYSYAHPFLPRAGLRQPNWQTSLISQS